MHATWCECHAIGDTSAFMSYNLIPLVIPTAILRTFEVGERIQWFNIGS